MKNSRQRNLILNIINNSFNHPNAYQIYEMARNTIPNLSLGTVYRNLNLLLENGMIKKIDGQDGIVHYDKIYNPHSHFICNICNTIYDLNKNIITDEYINNNKILSYDLIYRGICNNCLIKEED